MRKRNGEHNKLLVIDLDEKTKRAELKTKEVKQNVKEDPRPNRREARKEIDRPSVWERLPVKSLTNTGITKIVQV